MSNVLSEEKHQQVLALGRLGWSLRRIEQRTGVRRETAGAYLKAAGIAVRGPTSLWAMGLLPVSHVIRVQTSPSSTPFLPTPAETHNCGQLRDWQ